MTIKHGIWIEIGSVNNISRKDYTRHLVCMCLWRILLRVQRIVMDLKLF